MQAPRQLATPLEQLPGTARLGREETSRLPSRCGSGGLEGSTHGRGLCPLHAHLHPWGALHPVSACESAVQDAHGWAKN